MADAAPVVHIGENSPEQVAYKLLRLVAAADGVSIEGINRNASKEWIIKNYIMCRAATGGQSNVEYILGLAK